MKKLNNQGWGFGMMIFLMSILIFFLTIAIYFIYIYYDNFEQETEELTTPYINKEVL